MSNNKTSPRLAVGFFGAHYRPTDKVVYKAPEVIEVSSKQEEKTNLTKNPEVSSISESVINSLKDASLQLQNPLAIFKKD